MRVLVGLALSFCLAMTAESVSACSLLSTSALRGSSDVVVQGTYVEDGTDLQGAIKVKRTEKGQKMRSIKVRWEAEYIDDDGVPFNDGVGCPSLPLLIEGDSARFYLRREADQRYLVVGYDYVRERAEK